MAEKGREDEPGSEIEPAAPALPAPPAELPTDPAELRRFREFQQFQEFQRFQELQRSGDLERVTPPPEPPAAKPRRRLTDGLRSVAGKALTALLVLAAVIVGAAWAIDYFFTEEPLTPAEQAKQGGKKETATKLFAGDPYEAVRRIYDDIAQGNIEHACLRFAEGSDQQFAANLNHPTCADAVRAISAEVREQNGANAYAESLPSSTPGERYQEIQEVEPGGSITIDSCEAAVDARGVRGGPALGVFTVTTLPQATGQQWSVTGHRAGPAKCPRKSG